MEAKTQVLEAMKKEGVPLNAGKIVDLTNLDRKIVDKAMAELKVAELIISPKDVIGKQSKIVFKFNN